MSSVDVVLQSTLLYIVPETSRVVYDMNSKYVTFLSYDFRLQVLIAHLICFVFHHAQTFIFCSGTSSAE